MTTPVDKLAYVQVQTVGIPSGPASVPLSLHVEACERSQYEIRDLICELGTRLLGIGQGCIQSTEPQCDSVLDRAQRSQYQAESNCTMLSSILERL